MKIEVFPYIMWLLKKVYVVGHYAACTKLYMYIVQGDPYGYSHFGFVIGVRNLHMLERSVLHKYFRIFQRVDFSNCEVNNGVKN